MTLRELTKEDIQAVVSLEKTCFPDYWAEEEWFSTLSRADFHGWVIMEGERFVGFVAVTSLFEEAELLKIAIGQDYRGNGYGKRLLQYALERCKALGAERMFLEVRASNLAATGLYLGCGFSQTRLRKKYYADGEDGVEMVKNIV